ncbi:MAG: hypothetical protein SGI73_11765 [Chloroflexota bacterium]|nr:hypothetical protein [Chloroflexota bacterium]
MNLLDNLFPRPKPRFMIDIGSLLGGAVVGGLISAGLTLLFSPVNREQLQRALRRRSDAPRMSARSNDPAAERIAEGKAAARRMRAELGLDRE